MALLKTVLRYSPPSETIAVIVANTLPLVGVVALGWDLAALVFLYWFELGILSFWALVKAAFAGRPSEFDSDPLIGGALARKRTAIPVPFTELGVRFSTLPVLAVAIPVLTLVWFFAGVTTVGVIGPETPEPDALVMVTLSAFGIFLSEGASTSLEYFYRGGYRDHSAQTAIQDVFMRAAVIGVGGLLTATFVGLAADSVASDDPITAVDPTLVGFPILVGIVLVKFSFDLGGLYRDRLAAFDAASSLELGWAYEPPSDDPIEPVSDVDARLRPTLAGRLVGGLSPAHVRRHPGALAVGGFLLLISMLFLMGEVWDIVLVLVGAGFIVPMGLLTIDYGLRYGGVEYRISEEEIVAYDRLFRTRLWRIEPWDEHGVRVERDRLHGWLKTSTVVIERADRELRLPHLEDPEPILDVFDRRANGVQRTEET
ncbi:DUF6498-containing protein [Halopenitus persicus]|uniref:Uncharacterized protein n=1 Tax=Halopenitus persicus TaxID=1048396 RepID=A0A1H3H0K6_9EURY|nr:DUF6498-containing protein [Halopenitus persicus]SDY08448.1 hypothetical protein SAMN05216564_10349 [Halopenitus persicus]